MSKKDDKDPNHTGSVSATDDELTLWLNRFWARSEPPERFEVWQVFGKNKNTRGEMIHHEDFKAGDKLNIEQVNKMANEIIAAAQNDCDTLGKECTYQIAIIDRNRTSAPLVRRIGPLQPKRAYAIAKNGDVREEGDEDDLDAKTLNLRQLKEAIEQSRWVTSRNDHVVSGMLLLQDNIIKNQQTTIDKMMDRLVSSFEKMQEAEDRRVQRDIMLEREKFKIGLMKDGVRTARNLLPGIFAGAEADKAAPTASTNGSSESPKHFDASPERTLVDNFLHDCEEAKIDVALFGDFEEQNGRLIQVKQGIFSLKQFGILVGVRDGRLPAASLDDLMPGSGTETAITQDQIKKASDAGVTEGIGMSLMELVGMRNRAKELNPGLINRPANNPAQNEVQE